MYLIVLEAEVGNLAAILREVKELLTCVLNQKEEIETKYERLEKELDSFKTSLIAGQIVSSFERAVAQRILRETKQESNCIVTLHQIEDILDNKKSHFLPKYWKLKKKRTKLQATGRHWTSAMASVRIITPAYNNLNNVRTRPFDDDAGS